MAEPEIARFLSNLATESKVSGSTQNQALNALPFLYHHVLGKEIGYVNGVVRAKSSGPATENLKTQCRLGAIDCRPIVG
jgi:hypothetical protein